MLSSPEERQKIISEPAAHLGALLAAHQRAPIMPARSSGGVIPLCTDDRNGDVYMLFGLTKRGKWQTFHGFIDEGETLAQGAAREAWEESKGVLSAAALWRMISLPGVFSAPIGRHKNVFVVSFGEMTLGQRAGLCSTFRDAQSWSRSSDETTALGWFPIKYIRDITLAHHNSKKNADDVTGQQNEGESASADVDSKKAPAAAAAAVTTSDAAVSPSRRHHQHHRPKEDEEQRQPELGMNIDSRTGLRQTMRHSVSEMFSRHFWEHPVMDHVVEGGAIPLAPIGQLPPLDEQTLAQLPYRRIDAAAAASGDVRLA